MLKRFGTLLMSRPMGKEAFAAFQPNLAMIKPDEVIEIDFDGVATFSPSWGDEFLTPLLNQFGDRLILLPSDNLSVQATPQILQEANKRLFKTK